VRNKKQLSQQGISVGKVIYRHVTLLQKLQMNERGKENAEDAEDARATAEITSVMSWSYFRHRYCTAKSSEVQIDV
jgi:hypothetical protein